MAYSERGGSRPGFTVCGVADVQVLPGNINRKQAIIINDSDTIIYLIKGDGPAILNAGIRLNANGGVWIIEPDNYGRLWKGAIHAITSVAAKRLVWTEDW